MIIRFTYLASAVSLAAASKSAKTPGTPTPTDAAKAGKSTAPIASKSSKSKTSNEYFIAPFSCPQKCISAHGYELESHFLQDKVVECDASDSYQKWKVHRVGGFLKFESAAQYNHNMCLTVMHQDPDHVTNTAGFRYVISPTGSIPSSMYPLNSIFIPVTSGATPSAYDFSESDVGGICSYGKLGLAHCDHPGSNWYYTGGNLLSAFCWNHGASTAMTIADQGCDDVRVFNTTNTGDLTTSETFMILGSQ